MRQHKLNLKSFVGIFALLITFAACNSGGSSGTIADTALTPAYSSADSMQQNMGSDTSAMTQTDTSAAQSAANKSASTSKKKGRASVTIEPMDKNHKITMDKAGVYDYSEVMPAYPGGQDAIESYVNNAIGYPQPALDNSKEGRVVVSFIVDEDGKVQDAHSIGTKLGDGLDEEAVRVVSNMPKWTPGTVKGKPVKARVTLPITFKIEG